MLRGWFRASAKPMYRSVASTIRLPPSGRGVCQALAMIPGVDPKLCRTPAILADAAYAILNRDSRKHTGNFYLDDEVVAAEGVTDLDRYAVVPGTKKFIPDLFLD